MTLQCTKKYSRVRVGMRTYSIGTTPSRWDFISSRRLFEALISLIFIVSLNAAFACLLSLSLLLRSPFDAQDIELHG